MRYLLEVLLEVPAFRVIGFDADVKKKWVCESRILSLEAPIPRSVISSIMFNFVV
jgi:hypothetical protein